MIAGSAQAFSTQYDGYYSGNNVNAINQAIQWTPNYGYGQGNNYGYGQDYGHDFGNFYYGGYTGYHNPYKPNPYAYQPQYKVKWAPSNCQTIKVKQGCEWVWKKVCTRPW